MNWRRTGSSGAFVARATVAVALALLLAGCGGSGGTPPAAEAPRNAGPQSEEVLRSQGRHRGRRRLPGRDPRRAEGLRDLRPRRHRPRARPGDAAAAAQVSRRASRRRLRRAGAQRHRRPDRRRLRRPPVRPRVGPRRRGPARRPPRRLAGAPHRPRVRAIPRHLLPTARPSSPATGSGSTSSSGDRRARSTAIVAGRRVQLVTPGPVPHDAGAVGRDWGGFLANAGVRRGGSPTRLSIRVAVVYPGGRREALRMPPVRVSPGS